MPCLAELKEACGLLAGLEVPGGHCSSSQDLQRLASAAWLLTAPPAFLTSQL